MKHNEFIERIKSEFIGVRKALLVADWQPTASARHEYDSETYVFCEIITADLNLRNIIRLSACRFANGEIPPTINIDVVRIIFRSPSHPNIQKQDITAKTIFNGNLSQDGKDSEFSFPLLLGILNSVNGFFK